MYFFCLKKEKRQIKCEQAEKRKFQMLIGVLYLSSSANRALPYSAAWHLSITLHRGRETHFKCQSAGWDQTRKFGESRQLAAALIPPNQNTRGRSILKTGRSRLRRPDRNRCSAPRRNQEVLQSKQTGEKSVEDAAPPQPGCALGKVNSTENHRWRHLPLSSRAITDVWSYDTRE